MKIKKTSESIDRQYDAAGQATDRVGSANYTITDDDGVNIGNASIWSASANVNIAVSGFSTIEEGEEKIKAMLSIQDSEEQQ